MGTGKKRWLAVRWVVIVGIALLILGWFLAPWFLRPSVQRELARAWGAPVSVGSMMPGAHPIVLQNVSLGERAGVRVAATRVEVQVSAWECWKGWHGCVAGVLISGVEVHVKLPTGDGTRLGGLSGRGLGSRSLGEGAFGRRMLGQLPKTLELDGVSVLVSGGPGGVGMRVTGGEVALSRVSQEKHRLRLQARQVMLTGADGTGAAVPNPVVRAVADRGRWELTSVGGAGGHLDVSRALGMWSNVQSGAVDSDAVGSDAEATGTDGDAPKGTGTGGEPSGLSFWTAKVLAKMSERFVLEWDGLGVQGLGNLSAAGPTTAGPTTSRGHSVNGELSFRFEKEGSCGVFSGHGKMSPEGVADGFLKVCPSTGALTGKVHVQELPLSFLTLLAPDLPWKSPERGRASGVLELEEVPRVSLAHPVRVGVGGRLRLEHVAFQEPHVAESTVLLPRVELRGEALWTPEQRVLEVHRGKIGLGDLGRDGVPVHFEGAVQLAGEDVGLDVRAWLEPSRCAALAAAVPEGLLGDLRHGVWEGEMSGSARLRLPWRRLDDTELDLKVRSTCETVGDSGFPSPGVYRRPFLHAVPMPGGEFQEVRVGPGTRHWVELGSMSPWFVHAVLSREDARFFTHSGFAPWAIRDALVKDLKQGRFVFGASTITMQLAKNLFLSRVKTLSRKLREALWTQWLEGNFTKTELLALYFNAIEYGPGLYGIGPAALHYFGRPPGDLNLAESTFLALVLPSPTRMYSYRDRGLTPHMKHKMMQAMVHMLDKGRIDGVALEAGRAQLESFSFTGVDGSGLVPRDGFEGKYNGLPVRFTTLHESL